MGEPFDPLQLIDYKPDLFTVRQADDRLFLSRICPNLSFGGAAENCLGELYRQHTDAPLSKMNFCSGRSATVVFSHLSAPFADVMS